MKFHILIFGCQMNYSDGARIRAILLNCWFSYTDDITKADIVIFDTCSVKQKAEDKITGKLKEIWKHQKVWITWCMIQHNLRNSKINKDSKFKIWNFMWSLKTHNPEIIWLTTDEINEWNDSILKNWNIIGINHAFNPLFHNLIQKWKNIELFFRIDDVWFLPLILPKLWYKIKYDSEIINEYEKIIPNWINTSMNNHSSTAYVPVSTWCNQFCAYCIVPYARWLEKNFPVQQIVDEAKSHIKNWAKEIVLIWQIVNKHPDFIQIIKEILKIKWLERLRYTSPYPTFYSSELLELHEKEPKLCPHIHMPLQSSSDNILKKMFRWYTSSQFKNFVNNIRKLSRSISITTDIIIWFPWETEKDFEDTLKMVKYAKFDMIYMWIYSTRPWTIAERKYPDNIPYKVKHARWSKLNNLLKKISLENNQKEIWSIKKVLINEIISSDEFIGYTDNMKQIIIKNPNNKIIKLWNFVTVKITDGKPFKLYWENIS
jgi:tRNA-2-methylthio-N6-dimethylallyladenosine synthase